jgi:DNA-binding PucR family transcriptional regulator
MPTQRNMRERAPTRSDDGLMGAVDNPSDAEVRRGVAELASRLGDRLPELVSVISEALRDDIPELRDEAQLPLLDAGIEGNVTTALYALGHDTPVECVRAPTAALEQARRIAQQGLPVNVLVRIYRLGQRSFTHLALGELQRIDVSSQVRVTIVERITETLFAYVDWMSQQVVEVYEEERERWLETQNSMRALRVREVLAGRQSVDIDSATTAIRYPLRWHHVALVVWYPADAGEADEIARMQRFVRELGVAVQAGAAPLFMADDRSTGWAWLSFQVAPDGIVEAVREFSLQHRDSPSVAIGSPAAGVKGFRRSHAQAVAIRSVVLARKGAKPTVVAESDPGLSAAALVCGNIDDARAWIAEVLGRLAADTDSDARLRETFRVFLNAGASYTLAAEQLALHFNTVKYRVGRALARRGRPITDDRFDVELALQLCHWYGDALLLPPTP